jgi:glycosyltransferase involved in cell wall biosynthesis
MGNGYGENLTPDRKVLVTVIMPCLNEERRIIGALESLVEDWLLAEGEVLVMDGGSVDGTRRLVAEFAKRRGRTGGAAIRVLDNPGRFQVFALNAGIRAARGEFIVRADAHCLYPPGYVRTCVELLRAKEPEGAVNVGGVMEPVGTGFRQRAVALAMRHPLGVGDARFHLGTKSGFTDTVYLGAFRKSVLEDIGLFDVGKGPNEDAELNLRLLRSGRKIYLDHTLRVRYFPRETFTALARQYFAYGSGRARTTRKHRRVTGWRQVVPPLVVPASAAAVVVGIVQPLAWLLPASYLAAVLLGAVLIPVSGKEQPTDLRERIAAAWAMIVMHLSWGAGFDWDFLRSIFGRAE